MKFPFKSDYKLSPFPFQINHIGKLPAVFKYRVVVVVREKILDTVRLRKTASAVETECRRNIAGSDKQRSAVGITGKEKINQFFSS